MSNPKKPIDKPDSIPDSDAEKDPPSDLRREWENEDIELEGRLPNLSEDEEDAGDL